MSDGPLNELELPSASSGSLVVRSQVPSGLKYGDYRRYLRADFVYSCAYCSMSEAEAQAIRFTIDHYEPQASRPDLKDDYINLMYCCDECNTRKGDRSPPDIARAAGFRFFRPDNDNFDEHFERSGVRLDPKSATGDYSIQALDLNRLSLRRLRDMRARLVDCDSFVDSGVRALKNFQIDQLPKNIRGKALGSIRKADAVAERLVSDIESILNAYASSPLLDKDDPGSAHVEERRAKLAHIENLHPGQWRGSQRRTKADRKG